MKKYDKLVRDNIPTIIVASGKTAVIHTADDAEYKKKLYEKLHEEVAEFIEKPSVEEMADILEVLDAIAALHELDKQQVQRVQKEKAAERGGFSKKIILDES